MFISKPYEDLYKITYLIFLLLLLVCKPAALKRHILLHAVCIQLRYSHNIAPLYFEPSALTCHAKSSVVIIHTSHKNMQYLHLNALSSVNELSSVSALLAA